MSRIFYPDWYTEHWGLKAGRWNAQVKSALTGRPGLLKLQELHRALLILPQQRLLEGVLCRDGEVCALGALGRSYGIPLAEMAQVGTPSEYAGHIVYDDEEAVTRWAVEHLGVTSTLALVLQEVNDEFCRNATPEERYVKVLAWVERWWRSPIEAFDAYRAGGVP